MHCIFYFLRPHQIKALDTMFFKELHDLAVIVPIVAKSDVMTMSERKAYLRAVYFHIRSLQQDLGSRWDVIFNFDEETVPPPTEECERLGPGHSSTSPSADSTPLGAPFPVRDAAGDSLLDIIDLVGEPSDADSEDYAVSSAAGQPPDRSSPGRRSPDGLEELDYSHAFLSEISAEIAVDADDLLRGSSDEAAHSSSDRGLCMESPRCSPHHPSLMDGDGVRIASCCSVASAESVVDSEEQLPVVPNIFAIICSSGGGERVYPWGAVSVRDESCSDFRRLLRQLFEAEKIAVMREATQKRSIAFLRQRRPSSRMAQGRSLWPGTESACRWVAESKRWLFSAEFFPTLVLAMNLTMIVLAMTEVFYWTSSSAKSC